MIQRDTAADGARKHNNATRAGRSSDGGGGSGGGENRTERPIVEQ
jgi:hypothetical protein